MFVMENTCVIISWQTPEGRQPARRGESGKSCPRLERFAFYHCRRKGGVGCREARRLRFMTKAIPPNATTWPHVMPGTGSLLMVGND